MVDYLVIPAGEWLFVVFRWRLGVPLHCGRLVHEAEAPAHLGEKTRGCGLRHEDNSHLSRIDSCSAGTVLYCQLYLWQSNPMMLSWTCVGIEIQV